MGIIVNVDNFARAETDRMFAGLQRDAGAVNVLSHNRAPASVDHQTVIRMNRDTLYSFAVVDITAGATVTVPDHGDRYVSVMIVNEDHYINEILHEPGDHRLDLDRHGTPHVAVAARVLVDPNDPDDVAEATRLQDGLVLSADAAQPFAMPDYDAASLDTTRTALLTLAAGLTAFDRTFGARDDVDPVRHLIGTAAGWGGLPTGEATYVGVNPGLPVGRYELRVGEVPVDAFWSISVYNAEGYFEPNPSGVYSVNSVTGTRDADGSITVRFGGNGDAPNSIPITEGWNYLVRLYRPRPEILDGTWTFPTLEA
ncbi:MAG TPA: DUF1214 domain-containing protein [Acidimicrobiales bacterium]|nr:DUF1214 domain-containing protein [Acidimicrobiales bacterium]